MTEDELRALDRVTCRDAAKYIGMDVDRMKAQIKKGLYPWADAHKEDGPHHRWSFYIRREALIRWFRAEEM